MKFSYFSGGLILHIALVFLSGSADAMPEHRALQVIKENSDAPSIAAPYLAPAFAAFAKELSRFTLDVSTPENFYPEWIRSVSVSRSTDAGPFDTFVVTVTAQAGQSHQNT